MFQETEITQIILTPSKAWQEENGVYKVDYNFMKNVCIGTKDRKK